MVQYLKIATITTYLDVYVNMYECVKKLRIRV